jgi:hypothetical protein
MEACEKWLVKLRRLFFAGILETMIEEVSKRENTLKPNPTSKSEIASSFRTLIPKQRIRSI